MNQWISDLIDTYRPCKDARGWLIETNHPTAQKAWDNCERGDWMLRLLTKTQQLDNKMAVKISCRIVREIGEGVVWRLLTDERSTHAIQVAEAWLVGNATLEDVRAAADAAGAAAAYAADAAGAAAAYAAADSAACAADAADSAAYTADAAARAAYTAAAAARKSARKEIADIVRQEFPVVVLK